MADNYLERQQESYEARKAAWEKSKKLGKKKLKKPATTSPYHLESPETFSRSAETGYENASGFYAPGRGERNQ